MNPARKLVDDLQLVSSDDLRRELEILGAEQKALMTLLRASQAVERARHKELDSGSTRDRETDGAESRPGGGGRG